MYVCLCVEHRESNILNYSSIDAVIIHFIVLNTLCVAKYRVLKIQNYNWQRSKCERTKVKSKNNRRQKRERGELIIGREIQRTPFIGRATPKYFDFQFSQTKFLCVDAKADTDIPRLCCHHQKFLVLASRTSKARTTR